MRRLKIGYVSMHHANFTGDKMGQMARSVNELQALSKELGFDLFAYDKPVITKDDAKIAKFEIEQNKVDFLMLQSTAFNSGLIIPIFAAMDILLGLWSVPEHNMSGKLGLNSFCAMNMNASIIGEYLKDYDIKYKWFYGNAEDRMFIDRFKITVKALTALVNIRGSKIALIGGIAAGFDNQYFDERKLQKQFGLKLYRNLEFSDIKNRALSYETSKVQPLIDKMTVEYEIVSELARERIENNARVVMAIKEIAEENDFAAVTISC